MLPIPPHVQTVLTQLKKNHHTAYLVGGSLRDLLLGKEPHDWDVTTSARPEQTLAAFEGFPTIPTGLKHGTVTVLIDHIPIEITTYRVDGTYTDARRPDSVTFTDRLSEDLARRDFTVNAIAYSPDGGLVDLYGGQADLHAGILRAVGEPKKRFTEDALRILRGFRFSAQLNFAIEPQTLAAMSECREGLRKISAERILSELSRLLTAPAAARGLIAMVNTAILRLILPRTAPTKVWTAQDIDTAMAALPSELSVRLAWLFWGTPQDDIRADLNALKPPTKLKEEVLLLTAHTTPPTDASDPAARRMVRHYGELTDAVLSLWQCAGHDISALQAAANHVRAEGFCRTIADLPVSGNDLATEAGIPRGKALGETLKMLLEHVTDHPEDAKRDILLEIARRTDTGGTGDRSGGHIMTKKRTEMTDTREYFATYEAFPDSEIVSVTPRGIALRNGTFIDFPACAARFATAHGTNTVACVGERDIADFSFTFYTAPHPVMIKFVTKRTFPWIFAESKTRQRFCDLQQRIIDCGFRTYDMS